MEMVVVLAILAAMAAAATVATERVLYTRRFDLTRETLESLGAAVLGKAAPGQSPAQAYMADGFVADLGRPPLVTGLDPTLQAGELWANPRLLQSYGRKQSGTDPEVALNCGWRGPYLQLPVGATGLLDGWARPFAPLTVGVGGATVVAGVDEPIAGWLSYGSDGGVGVPAGNPPPLSEDLAKTLWTLDGATTARHWTSDITVVVNQLTSNGTFGVPQGSGTIVVRLYGPNPATGDILETTATPAAGPFVAAPQFTFAAVAIGPKVLRAYYGEVGEEEEALVSLKTTPLDIHVARTGTSHWVLTLPAPVVSSGSGDESGGGGSEATP